MALHANPKLQNTEMEQEVPTTKQFKRFDVVTDNASDHYYVNNDKKTKNNVKYFPDKVHKHIMKEWKILDKNLPDSIYVRAYEQRIDLLRAVIVGPAGTPYHDGLFFFDIAFPSNYPNNPPSVNYRSFGLRLNPNLYQDGFVCLSLLNTWRGNNNEKWNPKESTVLQVLVSIQGLVLNEKPYFNEPIRAYLSGRTKESLAYNANAYALSCKTMLYLRRRPPKNFENFVSMHFRERAKDILTACNAYMNGIVRVGDSIENGFLVPLGSVKVSKKFKVVMEPLFMELVEGFTRNGFSLGNFVEQLREHNDQFKPKVVVKKPKFGIMNFFWKIKIILGFKKVGKSNAEERKVKSVNRVA